MNDAGQEGGPARRSKQPRRLAGADFAAIFKSPKRARGPHFSLFWRAAEDFGLGMVVSKKLAGNAIRRNLVKRQTRAVFQSCCATSAHLPADRGLDIVIRVTSDIRSLERAQQFAEISALFAKCMHGGTERPA